jgi:alanyl-tRNA synthetase
MKNMTSQEIREIFLKFFEEKKHLRIAGASLIPANDPTLLFVNSGMAPLKKYFVGEATPPQPDLCNVQPCIRTRDIEDVGDRHHLTFFEMLGSWSINNYFKERAIELAYELLVDRFGLPTEKLYATVYKGNPDLNLAPDDVSAGAWEKVGLRRDQIVYLGEDNFWGPAGEFGPCGPCTEVFFDTGAEYGDAYQPGGHFDSSRRYIEIWNAGVFMELNKNPDGTFERLRFNSVDTGSGLERMTMTMNRFSDVYETDLMRPIYDAIESQLSGTRSSVSDYRVLTDHLRASTFILAEGVAPSNEGRGYIPRRLIRKAIALVKRAGMPGFDFAGIIDGIIERSAENYPALSKNRKQIIDTFTKEKQDFDRVIGKGLERLNNLCENPPFTLSGVDAFSLSATYGMPLELIRDFVRDRGGLLDEEKFHQEFRKHQEISRAVGSAEKSLIDVPSWPAVNERFDVLPSLGEPTEFQGYGATEGTGKVLALFRDGESVTDVISDERVEVVTDSTPFYAEGGGQVGDKGTIKSESGALLEVEDCIKVGAGYHVHRAVVTSGRLNLSDVVQLEVDVEHRQRVKANHSGTHLLHSVLRSVLGEHVKQSGSLVEANRLRFDFQHPAKVTAEQLLDIERLVNRYVRENIPTNTSVSSYDEAIQQGALALFGEKYGDKVRLVRFGSASAELCGGTHVEATGDIGLLRIVSEASIASGVRRIVAVTGEAALEYTLQRDQILKDISATLKVGADELPERIASLTSRSSKADNNGAKRSGAGVDLSSDAKTLSDGTKYIAAQVELGAAELREEALRVAHGIKGLACLVGMDEKGARVIIAIDKPLTNVYDANAILRELLPLVNGKGGGKKDLAQGGGDNVDGVSELLAQFPAVLERQALAVSP